MGSTVKFIVNDEQSEHADALLAYIARARHLDCMVAFAKDSAFELMLETLEHSLKRGMTARIAVGLSFHLTEPTTLQTLFGLSRVHNGLRLYLSNTEETFHPKVYAFKGTSRSTVFVGSANFTAGGFSKNYEASVQVNDVDGELAAEVEAYFDELIEGRHLVLATKKRIDEYAQEFTVHKAWREMAKRRADKINKEAVADLDVLAYHLREMKRDKSDKGFSMEQAHRSQQVVEAKTRIKRLGALKRPTPAAFLPMYRDLYKHFHSGGIHRQNSRIANQAPSFVAALADILKHRKQPPAEAFEVLRRHFLNIQGAGVNLLTEILHSLDNKRYAVMNQNAVVGLAIAGFSNYQLHPTKGAVDGDVYARFCNEALSVREELKLANFSELDALFNYVYWLETPDEEDDVDEENP